MSFSCQPYRDPIRLLLLFDSDPRAPGQLIMIDCNLMMYAVESTNQFTFEYK